jgi:thiol:disulfide interchange protein DsbD
MFKIFLTLLIYCGFSLAQAEITASPLPVEQAFAISGFMNKDKELVLQWNIAPGYYLYREQLKFIPNKFNKVEIGPILFPKGQVKKDELHGVYQSYSGLLTIHIPTVQGQKELGLDIHYQGCSTDKFCYPPITQYLNVDLSQITGPTDLTENIKNIDSTMSLPDQENVARLFNHHLFFILLSFLGLGIALSFTPCVLPMVPILSSIIVGYGKNISSKKAFLLSLSYVFGMAIAYAITGMIVALAGSSVQVVLQQPWVIILFSGLFVLLALSLFGFYDLRMPHKLQQYLAQLSHRYQGGNYFGVFMMGSLSTLIVSPCVSAPLVGVLTYIANSGSVMLGGLALLSLGLGMGIPLLVVGTSAGKFIPQSGQWMHKIKEFFGLLMLGMAIWMLARVIPQAITFVLWSLLIIVIAIFFWRLKRSQLLWHKFQHGIGLVCLCYGLVVLGGAMFGYADPLDLLKQQLTSEHTRGKIVFTKIRNITDLEQQLVLAKAQKKPVLLDFYADWCTACVIMEKYVFNQAEVQAALKNYILLKADVTQNNAFDKVLLKRFHVIAPPTMVFFDKQGIELSAQMIVGEVNKKELLAALLRKEINND